MVLALAPASWNGRPAAVGREDEAIPEGLQSLSSRELARRFEPTTFIAAMAGQPWLAAVTPLFVPKLVALVLVGDCVVARDALRVCRLLA